MKNMNFSPKYHAALAQYYRWYQVYETPFTDATIHHQLDILDDDIEIIAHSGSSKGKAEIPQRLMQFDGWQNAHHVEFVDVSEIGDSKLKLEADILYQNIRPDNSRYSYRIHYNTILIENDDVLPKFSTVTLQHIGLVKPAEFQAAYEENRVKSLIHYWLALMESSKTSVQQFKEILTSDFTMQLSSGELLNGYEAFARWFEVSLSQVSMSTHNINNLEIKLLNNGNFLVEVDFEWEGITFDGKPMNAITHHEWIVVNNTEERFGRLEQVKVSLINPFEANATF